MVKEVQVHPLIQVVLAELGRIIAVLALVLVREQERKVYQVIRVEKIFQVIQEKQDLGGTYICFAQSFEGHGTFSSNGSTGGKALDKTTTYHICPGGGGSGAGCINLFYTKNYNGNIKLEAKGGAGGSGVGSSSSAKSASGQNGGDGYVGATLINFQLNIYKLKNNKIKLNKYKKNT